MHIRSTMCLMRTTSDTPDPLKHGIYAPRLTRQELNALRKMPYDDLNPEIAILRLTIARLLDYYNQNKDVETAVLISNAITHAAKALNTLIRTHTQLDDDRYRDPIDEALNTVLNAEPFYITGDPPPIPTEMPELDLTPDEERYMHELFQVEPDPAAKHPTHFRSLRRHRRCRREPQLPADPDKLMAKLAAASGHPQPEKDAASLTSDTGAVHTSAVHTRAVKHPAGSPRPTLPSGSTPAPATPTPDEPAFKPIEFSPQPAAPRIDPPTAGTRAQHHSAPTPAQNHRPHRPESLTKSSNHKNHSPHTYPGCSNRDFSPPPAAPRIDPPAAPLRPYPCSKS